MAKINQIVYSDESVTEQAYNDMVDCPECFGLPLGTREEEIKRLWEEGSHPALDRALYNASESLIDYLNDEFNRLSREGYWIIQDRRYDIIDDVVSSAYEVYDILKKLPTSYSPDTLVLEWTDTDPVDATLEIDSGRYVARLVADGNEAYRELISEAIEDMHPSGKTYLVHSMLQALEGKLVDYAPSMEDLRRLPSRLIQRFLDQAAPFFIQEVLFEIEARYGKPDIDRVYEPGDSSIKDFPASAKKTLKKILDEVEQLED